MAKELNLVVTIIVLFLSKVTATTNATTTTTPPTTTRFPVSANSTTTKITTTKSPILNQNVTPIQNQRQLVADKYFPVKAISVDSENTDYQIFPLSPTAPQFSQFDNDKVEETFTYQVKKHKRLPLSPSELSDQFNFLQKRAKENDFVSDIQTQDRIKPNNDDIYTKIHNLSQVINETKLQTQRNDHAINRTLPEFELEFKNLAEVSSNTSAMLKLLQDNHEKEKYALVSQISNLTRQIVQMQIDKREESQHVQLTLRKIQEKLDNATHELRVHEGHLRYGQHNMVSLRNSINANVDRIAELKNADGPQWAKTTTGCGGVVLANSGIISYKFRQPYSNNERCVWIIRANTRSKINLQLLEDGFQNQSNSDFLTITEFALDESHPVTLLTSSRLEHGNNALHTFQGPVIFVTFYSDAHTTGNGFTLRFDGNGNSSDLIDINAERHTNLHFHTKHGIFVHPNEDGGTYQPNELLTVAINPKNASKLRIEMKRSDLEKDEYCEFDSISFYGSVTGHYALTKRYCQQQEKFSGEIINSSDGIFLMIFRSDASTQFSGFQFSWDAE